MKGYALRINASLISEKAANSLRSLFVFSGNWRIPLEMELNLKLICEITLSSVPLFDYDFHLLPCLKYHAKGGVNRKILTHPSDIWGCPVNC